ncbi:hypothetical protein CEUSTIGMA_g3351.t1 [Chlamydomonas eustigma]|uniref:Small ribosomal subunit protein bS18c n=1 Tax=Chlamydomonas eustigma TaxID=1157962 RepID=A0A250WYI8_9CHLO|nr:hypothetical protein CEUSTIGMA_g3351.t1 [Chlamydomonas eustigma]|eukprot:GAX75908.1 hypothetical protein CEUSTIGMA_g3351.t1 [Chlamydomonas eustigma]
MILRTFLSRPWVPNCMSPFSINIRTFTQDEEVASRKEPGVEASDGPPSDEIVSGPFKKSLSDLLGQNLAASLASLPQEGPTDAELDALFGIPSTSQDSARPSDTEDSAKLQQKPEGYSSNPPSQRPENSIQDPTEKLLSSQYGFAVLGGILPGKEEPAVGTSLLDSLSIAPQPRVHPKRSFIPGQIYDPSDLNAYAVPNSRGNTRQWPMRTIPSSLEVRQLADYKNVAFLSKFLSSSGRLLPRKKTKLPLKDHVRVMNQIKIARNMGFMAHETRLEKQYLPQLREAELRQAKEKGLL